MTDRTYLSFLLVYDIMKQEKMVHMKAILEYEVKIWEEKTVNIPSFN